MKIINKNGKEIELAEKEHVDSKNIEILNYNIHGYITGYEKIYNDNIKNCSSVLVTIIKVGAWHFTFEIQEKTTLVQIDGVNIFVDLDTKGGYIQINGIEGLGAEINYARITVRR